MSNVLTSETIITDNSFAGAIDQVVPSQLAVKTYIGHENTKEPTGFKDPELVVVTYDSSARTITLTGTVEAYYRGVQVAALTSGWVSDAIPPGPTQGYFLYYDGANFVWSTTVWSFDTLHIAYVYYEPSGTFRFAVRETHGLMPWQAHRELHEAVGTYLRSGGDLSSYVLGSTTAADRRPDVAVAVIADEDLQTSNPALSSKTYTHLYLTSTGNSTFVTGAAEILPVTGSTPYYNQFTGGNWVQTAVPAAQYTTVFLVAVPTTADAGSQTYRYLWLQGQSAGTLANEQAFIFQYMNLGQLANLATEFVPIAKVIVRNTGANWELTSVEKLIINRVASSTAAGNYISAVVTDATLTGIGTPSSPLSVATSALSHNSLGGLNGGTAGQYYHLTSAEYTGVGTGNFVRVNAPTVTGTWTLSGLVRNTNSTASTSSTTGALVVTGGVGVGGAINGGSTIRATSQLGPGVYTVATLPTGQNGDIVFCSNAMVPFGLPIRADGIAVDFAPHPTIPTGAVLYRTDWQGKQQLYPTARTNLCLRGQEIDNAYWVKAAGVTVTPNAGAAPDETTTADQVTFGGAGPAYLLRSGYITNGTSERRTMSIWLKGTAGEQIEFGDGWGDSTITFTGSWQRVEYCHAIGRDSTSLQLYPTVAAAPSPVLVWGAQVEIGTSATAYIPTTTAAVTVTDYTLSGVTFTLASAPASGSLVGLAMVGGLVSYSSSVWRGADGLPVVAGG